jgi:acyl-CoA reductase-like NAD-dependent aldehyde dehydrogenase
MELKNYVDGHWWDSSSTSRFESHNPHTGEVVASAPASDPHDVAAAVGAARKAFDHGPWPRIRATDRASALTALADALAKRESEAGELIAREMGKPIRVARGREVSGAVDRLRYFAGAARMLEGRVTGGLITELWDMELPEPVGVCALVIPWNDPIDLAVRKLGAALAVGCTVVLKPSGLTPASTAMLVELAHKAQIFPPGVINLVHGPGVPTGEALVSHGGVDKISFTGSTETGIRIMELAAKRLARVSLECGGKAPAIVYADADLDRCIDALSYGTFMYAGQSCSACTRLIVEASVHDRVVEGIIARTKSMPAGDPLDPSVLLGPMASKAQYDKAARYIAIGLSGGAEAALGGPPNGGDSLWIDPTILVDVAPDSRVTNEEIFGPVLSVHRFTSQQEALELANRTPFGLEASVWSRDINRALDTARGLDFSDIWVNTHYVRNAETSFGGRHMSGLGREMGRAGLEEYVAWKRICIDTRAPFHLKQWFEQAEEFGG